MPDDATVRGHSSEGVAAYRFHVHKAVPAWRLVRLGEAPVPPGLDMDDWRFTRARTADDTNPDVRSQCDANGFALFKLGGTTADVAADVAASRSPTRGSARWPGFNGRAEKHLSDSRTDVAVRLVNGDQWEVVGWLWQAFRHDLAAIVDGLPYSDGRYQAGPLQQFPSPDGAGYLAWRPHPNTGQDAPVGFALVTGLQHQRRSMLGFWVAPAIRREGVGRAFAADVLQRHPGPWSIGFQHRNVQAGAFWRDVADGTFGPHGWTEAQRPVPGRPEVPPDHFVETTS